MLRAPLFSETPRRWPAAASTAPGLCVLYSCPGSCSASLFVLSLPRKHLDPFLFLFAEPSQHNVEREAINQRSDLRRISPGACDILKTAQGWVSCPAKERLGKGLSTTRMLSANAFLPCSAASGRLAASWTDTDGHHRGRWTLGSDFMGWAIVFPFPGKHFLSSSFPGSSVEFFRQMSGPRACKKPKPAIIRTAPNLLTPSIEKKPINRLAGCSIETGRPR